MKTRSKKITRSHAAKSNLSTIVADDDQLKSDDISHLVSHIKNHNETSAKLNPVVKKKKGYRKKQFKQVESFIKILTTHYGMILL